METNISLYSYLLAAAAYVVLTVMLYLSRRKSKLGLIVIVSACASTIWAGTITWGTLLEYPPIPLIRLSELLRNGLWLYLLSTVLNSDQYELSRKTVIALITGLGLAAFIIMLPATPLFTVLAPYINWVSLRFIAWTSIALCGLVAIEQLYQNSSPGERWSNKFLCLGLGGIFIYDFFMYADALLLGGLNPALWQARGFINALAVPLIAIAVARNPVWQLEIHVSRQVVFHTATLVGAGIYLLAMSAAGYFIRYLGGSWGGVIQIFFLCGAVLLLMLMLFSGKLRAQTRVWLSKHFYSYRYDYREEWLNFTNRLSSPGEEAPQRVTRALSGMMESNAALLWSQQPDGSFNLLERWNIPEAQVPDPEALQSIAPWCKQSQWVIDITEYREQPQTYEGLLLPEAILNTPKAWLLLPLLQGKQLIGLLLMTESNLHPSVNWEDRDLLRTASQQAASYLAQYLANAALVEARQFEAFNRLSAYVIHDLKNILAQQSLIVTNARKHKHKPEFVDDVIMTIENSVTRMTKLMTQMRNGLRGSRSDTVNLQLLLQNIVQERSNSLPAPTLVSSGSPVTITADADQLATVFKHLIQNAQEACSKNDTITVTLSSEIEQARVTITDTGCGMDDDFIRERLFRPFDSTKGLTGMGIGAFESREYIRSLGGNIQVKSSVGEGSDFLIVIPLADTSDSDNVNDEQGDH